MRSVATDLLDQGLIITLLGMGLVFAALGLLWGILALLTRVFPAPAAAEPAAPIPAADSESSPGGRIRQRQKQPPRCTAERGRVAAIVAGALLANALLLAGGSPRRPDVRE